MQTVFVILLHKGAHFGRDKTYEKIATRFYWPGIFDDVRRLVSSCVECQKVNEVKFPKQSAPLHPVAIHPKVWHRVRCSFVVLMTVIAIIVNFCSLTDWN